MPDFSFGGNRVKVYLCAFYDAELPEAVHFCYFWKHGGVYRDEAQAFGSEVVHQSSVFNFRDDSWPNVNRFEPLFQYSSQRHFHGGQDGRCSVQ